MKNSNIITGIDIGTTKIAVIIAEEKEDEFELGLQDFNPR